VTAVSIRAGTPRPVAFAIFDPDRGRWVIFTEPETLGDVAAGLDQTPVVCSQLREVLADNHADLCIVEGRVVVAYASTQPRRVGEALRRSHATGAGRPLRVVPRPPAPAGGVASLVDVHAAIVAAEVGGCWPPARITAHHDDTRRWVELEFDPGATAAVDTWAIRFGYLPQRDTGTGRYGFGPDQHPRSFAPGWGLEAWTPIEEVGEPA
jgi:hypothetical protein